VSETDKARADRLERELEKVQHSVFRKRQEIRHLIRQLDQWKQDNTPTVLLKKEIEGLRSNMARIKFNGKKAAKQRDDLLAAVADLEEQIAWDPAASSRRLFAAAQKVRAEWADPTRRGEA
jgi:predicted RNase H-like nuclease (RuvC/YqgF family)